MGICRMRLRTRGKPVTNQRALPLIRLQRVLFILVVIFGTAVSLLLAHSMEAVQGADLTSIATAAVVDNAPAAAAHGVEAIAAASGTADNTFRDGLALCASIGFICGIALLVALKRLRKPPVEALLAPPVHWADLTGRPNALPHPVTLTALCIARV